MLSKDLKAEGEHWGLALRLSSEALRHGGLEVELIQPLRADAGALQRLSWYLMLSKDLKAEGEHWGLALRLSSEALRHGGLEVELIQPLRADAGALQRLSWYLMLSKDLKAEGEHWGLALRLSSEALRHGGLEVELIQPLRADAGALQRLSWYLMLSKDLKAEGEHWGLALRLSSEALRHGGLEVELIQPLRADAGALQRLSWYLMLSKDLKAEGEHWGLALRLSSEALRHGGLEVELIQPLRADAGALQRLSWYLMLSKDLKAEGEHWGLALRLSSEALRHGGLEVELIQPLRADAGALQRLSWYLMLSKDLKAEGEHWGLALRLSSEALRHGGLEVELIQPLRADAGALQRLSWYLMLSKDLKAEGEHWGLALRLSSEALRHGGLEVELIQPLRADAGALQRLSWYLMLSKDLKAEGEHWGLALRLSSEALRHGGLEVELIQPLRADAGALQRLSWYLMLSKDLKAEGEHWGLALRLSSEALRHGGLEVELIQPLRADAGALQRLSWYLMLSKDLKAEGEHWGLALRLSSEALRHGGLEVELIQPLRADAGALQRLSWYLMLSKDLKAEGEHWGLALRLSSEALRHGGLEVELIQPLRADAGALQRLSWYLMLSKDLKAEGEHWGLALRLSSEALRHGGLEVELIQPLRADAGALQRLSWYLMLSKDLKAEGEHWGLALRLSSEALRHGGLEVELIQPLRADAGALQRLSWYLMLSKDLKAEGEHWGLALRLSSEALRHGGLEVELIQPLRADAGALQRLSWYLMLSKDLKAEGEHWGLALRLSSEALRHGGLEVELIQPLRADAGALQRLSWYLMLSKDLKAEGEHWGLALRLSSEALRHGGLEVELIQPLRADAGALQRLSWYLMLSKDLKAEGEHWGLALRLSSEALRHGGLEVELIQPLRADAGALQRLSWYLMLSKDLKAEGEHWGLALRLSSEALRHGGLEVELIRPLRADAGALQRLSWYLMLSKDLKAEGEHWGLALRLSSEALRHGGLEVELIQPLRADAGALQRLSWYLMLSKDLKAEGEHWGLALRLSSEALRHGGLEVELIQPLRADAGALQRLSWYLMLSKDLKAEGEHWGLALRLSSEALRHGGLEVELIQPLRADAGALRRLSWYLMLSKDLKAEGEHWGLALRLSSEALRHGGLEVELIQPLRADAGALRRLSWYLMLSKDLKAEGEHWGLALRLSSEALRHGGLEVELIQPLRADAGGAA
ncbi:hypothetical protein V8C86DRAFT_3168267 [Haematococcus lacustris]